MKLTKKLNYSKNAKIFNNNTKIKIKILKKIYKICKVHK